MAGVVGFLGCLQTQWSEVPWPAETDVPEVSPLLKEESTGDRKFWYGDRARRQRTGYWHLKPVTLELLPRP